MPGVKNVPNAMPLTTTTGTRSAARAGHGSKAATAADAARPAMIGRAVPRRSDARPTTMLLPASSAAAARNTAPIATPERPRRASRSGASTSSTPKRSAGRTTNQNPPSSRRSPNAATSLRSGCGSSGVDGGVAAEDGAEESAAHGGRERRPDQLAPAAGGSGRDEPRQRAGPRERARHALDEPRDVELPRAVADAEEDDADGDGRQPDQHRALHAGARRDDAARNRTDEGAGRVGGREHARAGLAEPERVRVVRQQRRQRREEDRVDEDDRGRQKEDAPHRHRRYRSRPR